ncbi:hypothetical protein IPM09_02950 [Candidatus Saccharibacteria bacterium]|nr:MAG: hypothetical protein IPM09_02950 [Candidatus Saccharibacteria bacterium]
MDGLYLQLIGVTAVEIYWLIGPWPIIGYVVAVLTSLFFTIDASNRKAFFQIFGITFIVCAVIGNIATALFSFNGPQPRTGSAAAAAQSFGLDSGRSYPLVIGGITGGSSGTVRANAGLFSARASADLQPATAVTLSFTSGNGVDSWMLTIPTDKITFHQDASAPASMTVILTNAMYGPQARWDDPMSDCHWGISNLAIGCVKWPLNPEPQLKPEIKKLGLPPVIAGNIYHVDITLPPDLYNQVAGIRS